MNLDCMDLICTLRLTSIHSVTVVADNAVEVNKFRVLKFLLILLVLLVRRSPYELLSRLFTYAQANETLGR